MAILAEKRIGAVVVMERGAIRGIISERDIVRAVAQARRRGAGEARRRVHDGEGRDLPARGHDQRRHAEDDGGRFRHLPVVEDGKLAGIVSIGDVVKRRIEEVEREAEQIREYIATA